MNLPYTFLFHKGFCTVYLGNKKKNSVNLPHSAQRKYAFMVLKKVEPNKVAPGKKVALELLHHRLGHRFTRSLMAGENANFWQDIELRIDPYPFCTSCQIYSMSKEANSSN